jgi:hypothetical protein
MYVQMQKGNILREITLKILSFELLSFALNFGVFYYFFFLSFFLAVQLNSFIYILTRKNIPNSGSSYQDS